MPRDKDLKRVVRTRMKKTGESYTTARSRILDRSDSRKRAERAPAEPRPDYAALAGKRDEILLEKTGRTWEQWVRELDRHRAHEMAHRDIARLVSGEYGVPMWWTQTVTVGYERIKGLRKVGQRRGGGYEASRSKTLPLPLEELFPWAADARRRGRWWPGVKVTARATGRYPTVRAKHADGTTTALSFTAKGERCTITAVGSELPDKAAAEAFKEAWGARLQKLAGLVGRG
jgi:hypothetical protein